MLKMLSGISQIFTYCALQYLHYAPRLTTFLATILISECSIRVTRVFHYKLTVLLESIDLGNYVQCI